MLKSRKQDLRSMTRSNAWSPSDLTRASEPILNDLADAGVRLASVASRIRSEEDFTIAAPIMLKHLHLDYPGPIREALARSLATPQAIQFREDFIDLFVRLKGASLNFRYALGLAVANTTQAKNIEDTLALLNDPSLGEARVALLTAVKRFRKRPDVVEALALAVKDPQLSREVLSWPA